MGLKKKGVRGQWPVGQEPAFIKEGASATNSLGKYAKREPTERGPRLK